MNSNIEQWKKVIDDLLRLDVILCIKKEAAERIRKKHRSRKDFKRDYF